MILSIEWSDPRSELIALFPSGAFWYPVLIWWALTFFTMWVTAWAAQWMALQPYRRSISIDPDLHWTERARMLWPLRVRRPASAWIVFLGLAWLGSAAQGPLMPLTFRQFLGGLFLAGWMGLQMGSGSAEKLAYHPPVSWWGRVRTRWIRWVLFRSHIPACIALWLWIPSHFELRTAWMLGACVLYQTFVLLGGGVLFLRACGLASRAPEDLVHSLAKQAIAIGLRAPKLLRLRAEWLNAVAIPSARTILVTDRLMGELTPMQVQAVLAHELGHLAEPKWARWLRSTSIYSLYLTPLTIPLSNRFGFEWTAVGFAVWLLFWVLLKRLAVRWENKADQVAQQALGDPRDFAAALEAIYRGASIPAVMRRSQQNHPNLYDRMVASGFKPSFAKPALPNRSDGVLITMVVLLGTLLYSYFARVAIQEVQAANVWESPGSDELVIATLGEPYGLMAWSEEMWYIDENQRAVKGARFLLYSLPQSYESLTLVFRSIELLIDTGYSDQARWAFDAVPRYESEEAWAVVWRGFYAAWLEREAIAQAELKRVVTMAGLPLQEPKEGDWARPWFSEFDRILPREDFPKLIYLLRACDYPNLSAELEGQYRARNPDPSDVEWLDYYLENLP